MKKFFLSYGPIWLLAFFFFGSIPWKRYYYSLFMNSAETLSLGNAMILATQITGFLYLSRQIKRLQKPDAPQEETAPQVKEAPQSQETPQPPQS